MSEDAIEDVLHMSEDVVGDEATTSVGPFTHVAVITMVMPD
jgi:hypothetical protein